MCVWVSERCREWVREGGDNGMRDKKKCVTVCFIGLVFQFFHWPCVCRW